jgi:ABC-2 type transport system permease protein
MIILFIGLPALAVLMSILTGNIQDFPEIYLTTILATSVAGALGSIMIGTSITTEQNKNVYDLFLIRPVSRSSIILAKYIAAYCCLILAVFLAILTGAAIDFVRNTQLNEAFAKMTRDSIITVFFAVAITCAFGTLFGIVMKSVAGSALLSLYVGNQTSAVLTLIIPLFSEILARENGVSLPVDSLFITMMLGAGIAVAILVVALVIFNKKQF